ncbi:MAG TPA: WxcM-like domain-containing protein [Bacteriovoracaceae bacterium]|nr:WxcM-like domain-containing protein [Bacteriovoracaceae bacterium]
MIKSKNNPKIKTTSNNGKENGFLIPIINVHEKFVDEAQWPKQVYCTVAAPQEIKGPHLHKKRWGLFTCIKGNVKIVIRVDGKYEERFSGEDHNFATIQVPAGVPSALVNIGTTDAYILNMPSPSWHPDDKDDWDVEFADYKF